MVKLASLALPSYGLYISEALTLMKRKSGGAEGLVMKTSMGGELVMAMGAPDSSAMPKLTTADWPTAASLPLLPLGASGDDWDCTVRTFGINEKLRMKKGPGLI